MENDTIKVAIVGPESTGKTTLAEGLSAHFGLPYVPEFARHYLENRSGRYIEEDLKFMANEQLKLEDKMADENGELLICDTNLVSIKVWGEFKYGRCDSEIERMMKERRYDLHFLTDIDVPWQHDALRENADSNDRRELFELHMKVLDDLMVKYLVLSGTEEQRLKLAIRAIQEIMKSFG